jgi:hypothetical protein
MYVSDEVFCELVKDCDLCHHLINIVVTFSDTLGEKSIYKPSTLWKKFKKVVVVQLPLPFQQLNFVCLQAYSRDVKHA